MPWAAPRACPRATTGDCGVGATAPCRCCRGSASASSAAFGRLNAIAADPAACGLANVTDACVTPLVPPFRCQQPDTYLFWDGIHPTRAVHEILVQEAVTAASAP